MAGKELVRSTDDKMIGGVCAGLAAYLGMDTGLIRILTVVVSLFTGVPIIAYIIAMFVLPQRTTKLR